MVMMEDKRLNYILMDARAFNDVDDADVLGTANTVKEAITESKLHGNYKKYEVAICNSDCEVCWELYA